MREPCLKNPYTYRFECDVPYYQCDLNGNMKLSYLLKIMERAAGDHLTHLGLPYERLYSEGIVFLLAKLGVRIHRCPTAADQLVVETSPQAVKGAQFHRQIRVFGVDGSPLAEIHSVWLMVDPVERKILRPDRFAHELPTIPEEEQMERFGADRIRLAGEIIARDSFTVRYSDLDVNRHLNNTVYGDICTDLLPFDELCRRGVGEFLINYRHEALIGETISLTLRQDRESDRYYILGEREEGGCFEAMVRLGSEPPAASAGCSM
ncbi:MAG: hypothetical protein KH009_01090 [Clostridiales bacterium]|nr:hypothetical protein [Clostridiales bacterium]